MKYEKNVSLQNCSFQLNLQILSGMVSDKTYIFHLNLKKYDSISKIPLFKQNMLHTKKTLMGNYLPKWGL